MGDYQEDMQELVKTSEGRLKLINTLSHKEEDNWQVNILKPEIVKLMLDQIENQPEYRYLVLMNLEFLEYMVNEKGIAPEQIIFVADNKFEHGCARRVYGVKDFVFCVNKEESSIYTRIAGIFSDTRTMMPRTDKLVIVGNPPYHLKDTNDTSAGPIYQLFIEEAIKLNPQYLSLIVPSRWFSSGRGLEDFRKQMMDDKHLQSITHFADATQIFPDVAISGGVNYFLWNRDYNGKCNFNGSMRDLDEHKDFDTIITCNKALPIVAKSLSLKIRKMSDVVFNSSYFGIRTNNKTCLASDNNSTPCHFSRQTLKYVQGWKDPKQIIGKWKVLMTRVDGGAYNSGSIDEGLTQYRGIQKVLVAKPGEICTDTYFVVSSFDTEEQAKNCKAYMLTKFVRFLIGVKTNSPNLTRREFCFVPDPGSCDKIWTDEALYKMFKLTDEEIAFIESKIR
jgi:hypothetical protein